MPRLFLATILLAISSTAVLAQNKPEDLPEPYRTWLLEEVNWIIGHNERDTFLRLQSTTERDSFIDVFWRRRDENPTTELNETKEEHYARLEYVNKFFGRSTFREGWETDRGRYFIMLGPPRGKQNWESRDEVYPAELWFYNDAQLKRYNLPPFFYLLFFKRHAVGEYQLYNPIADGPQALLTRVTTNSMDFRNDTFQAWEELRFVDPELAHASLSFRTDEGDIAQFQNPSFGSIELVDDIVKAPLVGVDTSYADRLDFERGSVESDYMFTFVPSVGMINILPGPEGAGYLHWVVQVDAKNVAFVEDKESGYYASVFIASMEVVPKDDPERIVLQYRRESFIQLDPGDDALLQQPISYTGMTPLVPGEYTVRIILRNRACPSRVERDCLRGYALLDGDVTIPEWPTDRAVLGDLVVGYGTRVRSGEPVYRAYRFGHQEVFPNPTAVYAVGDPLVAAIEPKGAPDGSQMRFQITRSELDAAYAADAGAVIDQTVPLEAGPVIRELALDDIDPGRYDLNAILVDPSGTELDRRRVPFTISPRTAVIRPGVRGSAPQIPSEVPGMLDMAFGEQYVGLEQHEKAIPLFEVALAENPKLGRAREYLAAYAMESGDTARVVQLLEPVYASVADRYEVLELLGRAYFRQEDYPKSIEVLEKAIIIRRPQPAMLNMLANAQYRNGNPTRAVELLQRSLSIDAEQVGIQGLIEKIESQRASSPN